jgi:predicted transcriptional regulator
MNNLKYLYSRLYACEQELENCRYSDTELQNIYNSIEAEIKMELEKEENDVV